MVLALKLERLAKVVGDAGICFKFFHDMCCSNDGGTVFSAMSGVLPRAFNYRMYGLKQIKKQVLRIIHQSPERQGVHPNTLP